MMKQTHQKQGHKYNQKEAVYNAVMNVLNENGIEVADGQSVADALDREDRAQINDILFEGFRSGQIELATEFPTDAALKAYVSGLQSNWLRKDKRLNGGAPYVPKNPGSRENMGDAQLKAMRQLLATKTNASERAEIQEYIDKRKAELAAQRKPQADIDYSILPAGLRTKYGQTAGKKSNAA